jgi:flagellar hook-associated protein 3 FlgL
VASAISMQSILSSIQYSVGKVQAELADRSKELSSGQHSDLGLTLGSRSNLLVSLHAETSSLQTLTETNNLVSARLDTTQSKLDSIQSSAEDVLNSLLTLSRSNVSTRTIQELGKNELSSLISQMNSSLGGDFLFAGTNTDVRPIVDYTAPSSSAKTAVDAAFFSKFGFVQSSSNVSGISGTDMQDFLDDQFAALFQDPNWSSNWSSAANQELTDRISPTRTVKTSVSANETAFRQLAQAYTMLADLGTRDLGTSAYDAVTTTAGDLVRQAIDGLTDLRASVGSVQADIEDASDQMSLQTSLLKTHSSDLTDVDPFDVSSHLSELQTQLEASYSLTAQLRELSLAHYL